MAAYIIVALIAYAIGSINFSVLISKKIAGFDVREKGSGNAGTTNMLRSIGKGAAAITLICDILKGVVSVFVAFIIHKIFKELDGALLVQIAALAVVIGHTFPIFFGFKGGKGVATSLGILLCINWKIGLVCLVFALIIMAVTKMVSAGSVTAAILYPVLVLCQVGKEYFIVPGSYIVFSILLALLVAFNHRTNIKRILEGKENKLNFKKN
ncbi:MAG: glycerol-3-phosphate 1-O-acyltransferase PlsY [Clostridia bacterium]|nr:glycerol-3-phosphate 1-O-acyltransferase PlsY [Clostridia bacterium]